MERKTGEKITDGGYYESECGCFFIIITKRGETAPRCPKCGAETQWRFAGAARPPQQSEPP